MRSNKEKWMQVALEEARLAAERQEVPVGAVLVCGEQIISRAGNRREELQSPLGHAEMIVLHQGAKKKGHWRLSDCELYVTLEPCPMCAGAMLQARLGRLVFATRDPKAGAVSSLYQLTSDSRLNHQIEVEEGLFATEASQLLKDFFQQLRQKKSRS